MAIVANPAVQAIGLLAQRDLRGQLVFVNWDKDGFSGAVFSAHI